MQVAISRSGGRRGWLAGGVAALVAVSAIFAFMRGRAAPAPQLGPASTAVAPGIYLLRGLGPSVAYAVETPSGLVLIDSGLKADAGPLKSELSKLRLDWRGTRAIFLTHVHGDHTGGAGAVRKVTGARVYAGKGDAPALVEGTSRDAVFGQFYMPDDAPHPTPVDVELAGDETVEFGDVRIRAVAAPGHTPGSVCYLLQRGPLRVLFTGDVVKSLGGPSPLGVYSTYLAPRYGGDVASYIDTLERLRALPVPDLVLPGHPSPVPPYDVPRLTPEGWTAMLDAGLREMKTLKARFDADGADFLDGAPKRLLPGLYYFGDFRGKALYGLSASSRFCLVGVGGGTGVVDFLKARLRTLGLAPTRPDAVLLTSCEAEDQPALDELIEAFHPSVVTSPQGLAKVREVCPPGTGVVSADPWAGESRLEVSAISLPGPGRTPVAYRLRWAGKTVLFTGRVPARFDEEAMVTLPAKPPEPRESALEFLASVHRLDAIKPDLWLPSTPSGGQNANLYDDDWKELIGSNYRVGHFKLRRAAPGG